MRLKTVNGILHLEERWKQICRLSEQQIFNMTRRSLHGSVRGQNAYFPCVLNIDLHVYNVTNIGGIGQIILCPRRISEIYKEKTFTGLKWFRKIFALR